MRVGVPRETFPGERRVAVTPMVVSLLQKGGFEVLVEPGAGEGAGFPDSSYQAAGAEMARDRDDLFARADIIAQVRGLGANPERGREDLERLRKGQVLVGFQEPLTEPEAVRLLAERGVTLFALELLPRITRAQPMDALTSQATIAGYKAVLLAASALPRIFPMVMSAAGTITPARVFVIGAGVAGLQAIATARRLGAVVQAYDIRPAVKEQVQSLGAKFVELPLETGEAEDRSGYARAMDESFYRRQAELMKVVVAESDVVISTAMVPGQRAPVLITEDMVKAMRPGSVIVDLAAERGGNCALTRPGETVTVHGVTILGPVNLPSTVPADASFLYSRNIAHFLTHLAPKGQWSINREDPIVQGTLVLLEGEVVHPQVRERLALGSSQP